MATVPPSGRPPPLRAGPVIHAPQLWQHCPDPLSTGATDPQLAEIASVVRFHRGEFLCRQDEPAVAMFSLISGAASAWLRTPEEGQQVIGFLFANDLVGLSRDGLYRDTAKAVAPVTAYRLPADALERRLRRSPELAFAVIRKLSHDLHAAHEYALMMSRPRAVSRLAVFLQRQAARVRDGSDGSHEIFLPMSRTEIALYLNITPEAVSRSFAELLRQGTIRVRERRFVSILDHAALAELVVAPRTGGPGSEPGGGAPPGQSDPDDAPCTF